MGKDLPRLRLRNIIEKSCFQKREIAHELGISPQVMTNILTGKYKHLPVEYIDKMCLKLKYLPVEMLTKKEHERYLADLKLPY